MKFVEDQDSAVQVNNQARSVVTGALKLIPEIGGPLSALVTVFWVEQGDVWESIRNRVERLVDKKIDENNFRIFTQSLTGLRNQIDEYQKAVKQDDKERIRTRWELVNGSFLANEPHFLGDAMEPHVKLIMAPLLAKFGTMYFAHLRDAIDYGQGYGMSAEAIDDCRSTFEKKLARFSEHIDAVYATGIEGVKKAHDWPVGKEKWNGIGRPPVRLRVEAMQAYFDFHNLYVHDVYNFVDLWRFMHPDCTLEAPEMKHEIYTPVRGTWHDPQLLPDIPLAPKNKRITKITTWSGDYLDGFEVAYGGSSSGRLGATRGGNLMIEMALSPGEYITSVKVGGAPFIGYLGLESNKRLTTCGAHQRDVSEFNFDGMCLSSVHSVPTNTYQRVHMYFGFKYKNGFGDSFEDDKPSMRTLRALYGATGHKEALIEKVESRWKLGQEMREAIQRENWDVPLVPKPRQKPQKSEG